MKGWTRLLLGGLVAMNATSIPAALCHAAEARLKASAAAARVADTKWVRHRQVLKLCADHTFNIYDFAGRHRSGKWTQIGNRVYLVYENVGNSETFVLNGDGNELRSPAPGSASWQRAR